MSSSAARRRCGELTADPPTISSPQRRLLTSALYLVDSIRDVIAEIQCGTRHAHRLVLFVRSGQLAREGVILERQAIGVLEEEILAKPVVDDVRGVDALLSQLLMRLHQRTLRSGFKGEVIECGGDAKPSVDARIERRRHTGNLVRLHESDELIASHI